MQTVRRALTRVVDSPVPPARRRIAVLAMAVALAAPVYSVSVTLAQATPAAAVSADSPLAAASALLKAGKYEEALTALQAIKVDALSDADKTALAEATTAAQQGTQMRRAARADFDMGQRALEGGDTTTAAISFKNVVANQYADEGTRAKAQEQLALADAGVKGANTDWKAMYDDAVADYKAGSLDAAKTKFTALQNAGYKAPWFSTSPRDYLEKIDAQAGAGGNSAEQARAAYLTGRDQYKKGDWIAARQNFNKATELGYKAGFFEDEPAKYLARMDKKEQADAALAAKADANSRPSRAAMVAMAPAAETTPAPTPNAAGNTGDMAPVAASTAPAEAGTAIVAVPADDQARLAANVKQLEAEKANKVYQATKLTADAKTAEDNQRYAEARDLYTQAANLDPANADAQAGRNRMLVTTGRDTVQQDPGVRIEQQIEARRAAVRFSFNDSLAKAREQTARGEFDAALTSLEVAAAATRSDTGLFNNQENQAFATQLADARTARETAIIAKREADTREAAVIADRDAVAKEQIANENKERSIAALIAESRRLSEQGRYKEALKVVDQILNLDRNNQYAVNVKNILFDRASLQGQRENREVYERARINQLDLIREKEIPYPDVLTYPTDWPDLAARREQTLRDERQGTASDDAINAVLDKTLPNLPFDQIGFKDVLDYLAEITQANIDVNWQAVEAAGIDRNTPITLKLRNVKLSKVLQLVLEKVSNATTTQLGYTVSDGVISITTSEALARNAITRTYDIRDLILQVPDFEGPELSLENQNSSNQARGGSQGAGAGQAAGGGGGNLFGGGGNSGGNNNNQNNQSREDLVDSITSLIRDTIGQGTWKEDGGTQGNLRELGGQLIVLQTPEVHREITGLLSKLREQRSIQVMVETRFLTVQKNFLEDVGIDFDFYFNFDGNPFAGVVPGGTIPAGLSAGAASGTAGNVVSGVTQAGIDPTTGLPTAANPGRVRTGVAPIGVSQSSSTFTQASTLNTGTTGNLAGSFSTPNLATSVNAFLDDFQASLFFRATQGNQNVTQLTAPRLTLFNGQQAYLAVTTDVSYVSDLEPVVGQSAFAFNPTIQTLQTGVVLSVQATVSADRKYVTLNLFPQLSRLISIDSFPIFGQTTATTNTTVVTTPGTGTGTGTTPVVTGQTSIGFIQQPTIQRTVVRTSVSVPDGGTLLLGGTTVSGEIEREAGVPVLSKIPFLKRAFTNRSQARDESVLLILVKPTIIIQREIEQQNFPLLTNRPG